MRSAKAKKLIKKFLKKYPFLKKMWREREKAYGEIMNKKEMIKAELAAGLFFLGLGGWFLHLRIHPPAKNAANLIPFISGIGSVFCLPPLFWFSNSIRPGKHFLEMRQAMMYRFLLFKPGCGGLFIS